jgi:hypothetical protein
MVPPAPAETTKTLSETVRSGILTSIPLVSALTFVIVAIKVFRVSGMETTTTVAIVSTADTLALLKGVVLTLLPGFLEVLTAAAVWAYRSVLPIQDLADGDDLKKAARGALLSPEAAVAWALTVTAFFTIAWPIFALFFLPMAATTASLALESVTGRRRGTRRWLRRWHRALGVVSIAIAAVAICLLALAPTVWTPLRAVTFAPNHAPATLQGKQLEPKLAAYVLNEDDKGVTLLVDDPRGVVELGADELEPDKPFCVAPESSTRWLSLRLSQVVHIDQDNHSPYQVCPGLSAQGLLGRF